jgi:hypothetical protein
MELKPSAKAVTCAATQELLNILWKLKIYYHVHNSLSLVPILNHIKFLPS